MNAISARQDQGIPGVYALLLCEVVSRWGYSAEAFFAPFHLTTDQLAQPDFRIATRTANDLVKHALKITGATSLGVQLGMQMGISIHGFIGYAIMTAPDLAAAFVLANRFIQLRLPFIQLYCASIEHQATLQLQCDIEIEPLRTEIVTSLTLGMLTMAKTLTGIEQLNADIDFDFPKPIGFDHELSQLAGYRIRFEQAHLLTSFNEKYLSLKMVNADPLANQVAIKQCEAELAAFTERRRLSIQVRDILSGTEQHYLSIKHVATRLHMSDRTLKRQLAAEGTCFSALVDEVRYRYATSLLSRTDYSLEQIADELGYSDVANFSRAFKRWSGRSPSSWRKDP